MPATRRIRFLRITALGACLAAALLVAWLVCSPALQSPVSLSFVSYEQRLGDASYYARLALTNRSSRRINYMQALHTGHADALNVPLITVPVRCSEKTLRGWSTGKWDGSSVGDTAGDQHLDPDQDATFLVPVVSGAPPKRVGLDYWFHTSEGGTSKIGRALWWLRCRLRAAFGLHLPGYGTVWCSEILVAPKP
jgi:hypothetical protein